MMRAMGGSGSVAAALTPPAGPGSAERHWTRGDRRGALRVLLPAEPGRSVVAVAPAVAPVLAELLDATVVEHDAWPEPGSADLVVVDERLHDVRRARAVLSTGGTLAVIGRTGAWQIHPDADLPEVLWRPGHAVHPAPDLAGWARRRAGLVGHRGTTRLSVRGPERASLADAVLDDLEAATGVAGRLVGVVTAGRTVLRVRRHDGDVAVRLRLRDVGRIVDVADAVVAEVPAVAAFLPAAVARGETLGHPWRAVRWSSPTRPPLSGRRQTTEARRTAAALVDLLAEHPTGATERGWAARWAASADLLPAAERAAWTDLMRPAEDGLVTAWCHGDLWSGSLVHDGAACVVLDWDNASPDAPAGLDRLLASALDGRVTTPGAWLGEVLRHVDEPEVLGTTEVGGRPWGAWDRRHRLALVVAALVLHLRNRSVDGPHGDDLVRRAAELVAATAEQRDDGRGDALGSAGRTARGALWLAANGVVVKASQTVVLLILAALLAPESLGLVALGTLVANVSVVLASLGTASALVFWRGEVERAARTAVTLALASGGVITALLWVTAPWLSDALDAGSQGPAVIRGLTVTLPLVAVAAVTNELLRRRLAFLRRIIPDTTAAVVGAVVAVTLALHGQGVMALVVGQVVQGVLTLLLAWCVHPPVRPGWDRRDARELLSYGGPYAGANLIQLFQLNVDYVVVSLVLGAAALGQYSLAFRISFMPYLMIAVVVAGAAFPYLCRVSGARLAGAATTVMSATLTLVTPVCVGLAVFADHLVLLGDKWSDAVPVMVLLAGYGWVLAISTLVQTVLNASGRTMVAMTLRLAHLAMLLLGLTLFSHLGIEAVAASQLVSASVAGVIALLVLRTVVIDVSLRALARALRPAAAAAATMAAVLLVLRSLLRAGGHDPSTVTLVVGAVVGLVAYVVPLVLLDRNRAVALRGLVRGGA